MGKIKTSKIDGIDFEDNLTQGNTYNIVLDYLQPTATSTTENPVYEPRDISTNTFFGQLRSQKAELGGTPIYSFSTTPDNPDADNNYYEKITADGKVIYHFSDEITRSLRAGSKYYFEVKTRDALGNNIESVIFILTARAEYARETV